MKPFIGYHFFHGVGRITPVEAYSRTQHAMNNFADPKMPSYRGFILDTRDDEGGPWHSAFEGLCAQFGPVSDTRESISAHGVPTYRAHYWTLTVERFEKSFSVLEKIQKEMPAVASRVSIQGLLEFQVCSTGNRNLAAESRGNARNRHAPRAGFLAQLNNRTKDIRQRVVPVPVRECIPGLRRLCM
jgi:hypothetical protein